MKRICLARTALQVAFAVVVAACSSCDSGGGNTFELKSPPVPDAIKASDFVSGISNPLWPVPVGMKWSYRSETADGVEETTVEVLPGTRTVEGVSAVVLHDSVTLDGALIEDTYDWYAQDKSGNVWYVGEDSKEYRNGVVVSTAGSWESGVNGARAGIYMYASPKVGDFYYQEYYPGEAEDVGEVIAVNQTVTVPAGTYSGCAKIQETTPLEPDVLEHKYVCPGVGLVLTLDVAGGNVRDELTAVEPSGS